MVQLIEHIQFIMLGIRPKYSNWAWTYIKIWKSMIESCVATVSFNFGDIWNFFFSISSRSTRSSIVVNTQRKYTFKTLAILFVSRQNAECSTINFQNNGAAEVRHILRLIFLRISEDWYFYAYQKIDISTHIRLTINLIDKTARLIQCTFIDFNSFTYLVRLTCIQF